MPRESTDQVLLSDEVLDAALRELKAAGGEKRYIHCRFGFAVAGRLQHAGLAAIDDGPTHTAMVRLTLKGRIVLATKL